MNSPAGSIRRAVLATLTVALVLGASAAASAETLMMPKRDGLKGTQLVVWGITTQPNGTPYSIDFGDGSPVFNATVIDRSYINITKTYAVAGNFTATLTVGAESATVALQIFDPALLTADNLRSLKVNMAIQDGLRYLWLSQLNRTTFDTNSQTFWGGGTWQSSYTSLVTLAFENHGYKLPNDNSAPTGLYQKYLVRRGLNFVVASFTPITLFSQGSGFAGQPVRDPCVGAGIEASPCTGLADRRHDTFHEAYTTGVAILALAGSGALSRTNTEVGGYVSGKTYGEILQRATNALAWGQIDVNNASRGGWFYNFNSTSSDGSTLGWDILAMLDANAAGAVVPAWVASEFAYALTGGLNNDGSLDYRANGDPASNHAVGPQKNGISLQGMFLTGETTGARRQSVIDNVNSWWSGAGGMGGNSWGGCPSLNKGCGYTMFNNFKGLKLQGVTTLPNVTRPAGPGSQPAGDWYADYVDFLVATQNAPHTGSGGNWPGMGFSCCDSSQAMKVAIAELILSPVALVLPDEIKFKTVGLTPPTNTAIEGGSHTVTAKAESTGGSAVPGATVNFTILSGPNAGLTGTGTTDSNGLATFTYTDAGPDGTIGTDKIQAKIGNLESNIVEMNWTPKNSPPAAGDDAYSTDEDTLLTVPANGVLGNDNDPDSDPLVITLLSTTTSGSLTLNPDGSFSYMPNAEFSGADSFTYEIADDKGATSNVATVTITVTAVNDPPVAADDAYTTAEDTPLTIVPPGVIVNDTDIDGGALSSAIVAGASNGTVSLAPNGGFVYTPNANFYGTDSFTYLVNDGSANSNVATVIITVTSVNDDPSCALAAPSVAQIWPPNHQLVNVGVNGVVDPVEGSGITITITAIRQDEPTNTQGDGNTPIDGYGVGTSTAQVRAERSGTPRTPGDGRVYHISFTGTDADGGSCTGTVKVGVPHDQGQRRIPVDGGPIYSSTGS